MNLIRNRLRKTSSIKEDFKSYVLNIKNKQGEDAAFNFLDREGFFDEKAVFNDIDEYIETFDNDEYENGHEIDIISKDLSISKEELISQIKQKAIGNKYFTFPYNGHPDNGVEVDKIIVYKTFEDLLNDIIEHPSDFGINTSYFDIEK